MSGGRLRRGFGVLAVGAFLAGIVLAVASAGTITRPGPRGPVKAKGLTPSERKALEIVSVKAAGVEPLGLLVTVTFGGNIEQALGRSHLKNGLVALILRPKKSSFAISGLATQGAGAIGQTLSKTRSENVGVVRNGRRLTFFIGGPGFENVGKVDVKAFATAPIARGSRNPQAAGRQSDTAEDWKKIAEAIAADEAALTAPGAETSCAELKALRAAADGLLDRAKSRDEDLRRAKRRLERTLPIIEELLSNGELAKAAATLALVATSISPVVGPIVGTKVYVPQKQQVQDLRDALRGLKLDLRLVDAYIEKNSELIANIAKLQGRIEGLLSDMCNPGGTTQRARPEPKLRPIHAVFDPSTFSTTYTENASSAETEDGLFSAYLAPKGFKRDPSDDDRAANSTTGQNAVWDPQKEQWIDGETGKPLSPSAKLSFAWAVAIPADPACATVFKGNGNQATWYHADVTQGGQCNHGRTTTGPRGHPGTVVVVVSNERWSCVATYEGTEGDNGNSAGDGPAPRPCVKK